MLRMPFALLLAGVSDVAAPAGWADEAGSATSPSRDAFLGIWEGIDPLDGSTVRLMITVVDGGKVLELS